MDRQALVRLELEAGILQRLLDKGELCVSEFRCLDCNSKRCVWKLCLMNCGKHVKADSSQCRHCEHCGNLRIPISTTLTITSEIINHQETT